MIAGSKPNPKSEPGAVAAGRMLNLFKALTGRYRSRF